MDNSSPNAKNERLEQIVAYLDGELSPEESSRVEEQLARDEEFRQELQGIDLAWAALDKLPAVTVDDKFSKTTMELVVQDARREVQQRTIALPIQKKKRHLATALMLGTCVLLGLLFSRIMLNGPNRELMANLPVIEYIDLYSQFEQVDFAESLHQELSFLPELTGYDEEKVKQEIADFKKVSHAENAQAWIDELSPEEKASLRVKYNRFHTLPRDEQEERRKLHEQVAKLDQKQLSTLLYFNQWLHTIPAVQQYEIRQPPDPEFRARLVADMIADEQREKALELSEEELGNIKRIAIRFILEEYSRSDKKTKKEFANADFDEKLKLFRRLMMNSPRRLEIYTEILDLLPEYTRRYLEDMSQRERARQMQSWLWKAHQLQLPKGKREKISEEQLEDFFATELTVAEQEKLLALSRDQMLKQLDRMYRGETQEMMRPGPWGDGPHRGRGRGPGPPRSGERRRQDRVGPPGPPRRDGNSEPPFFEGPPPERGRRGFGAPRQSKDFGPPPKND